MEEDMEVLQMSISDEEQENTIQPSFDCAKSTQVPLRNQHKAEKAQLTRNEEDNIPDDYEQLMLQQDEFELQYQEELDLMDNLANDGDAFNAYAKNKRIATPVAQPALNSRHLSDDDNDLPLRNAPVNRRLFDAPKVLLDLLTEESPKKQCLSQQASTSKSAAKQQLLEKRNKRFLERDLFDIYLNEDYEDPQAKKARTEKERDMQTIAKLLETRKKLGDTNHKSLKNEAQHLQELYEFKCRNLSITVPAYSSLPLIGCNKQRIFVRYHNEQFESSAINELHCLTGFGNILGAQRDAIWEAANEIIVRRLAAQQARNANVEPNICLETAATEKLWVEKYKPRKYVDLLSDETANRNLLTWLKMWDRVVFGREFKTHEIKTETHKMSSFNKRTGKFEMNGGWQTRKQRFGLNTKTDELGRPMQKVALLSGPPGVGKTTLAHIIATHAGYVAREVNASDDRSPDAFKLALENGTEMTSVLNKNNCPNCIILDEIDGAPKRSIEFLVKYVSDGFIQKSKPGSGKSQRKVLKRPIICICNDLYEPALRPLRQIAFVVTFPPIESARLAQRLLEISQKERLKTDFSALIALAEKSGNDVRSCIGTMQFFSTQKKRLTLLEVLKQNLGQKDRFKSLFEVWGAVFQIQRPKRCLNKEFSSDGSDEKSLVTMTDMSNRQRAQNVLEVVHSCGDNERLMQGVYENFLQHKKPDPMLYGAVEALNWFSFNDQLQHIINSQQNYAVYPYLQYAFVAWHLIFATLAWPKLIFPTHGFEFRQKLAAHEHRYQTFLKRLAPNAVAVGRGSALLLDTVSPLKRILAPTLRTVPVQLFTTKEKSDLWHTIDVLLDFGMVFTQVKSTDGSFAYHMEPDLDNLLQFPEHPVITLPHFSRQLIAQQLDLERIRRAAPKFRDEDGQYISKAAVSEKVVPNHLVKLQPKVMQARNLSNSKAGIASDIFGRVIVKENTNCSTNKNGINNAGDSNIIFLYKEGFNNAVRKSILVKDLL